MKQKELDLKKALHTLLWEHPGLNIQDISLSLQMSIKDAEKLLTSEEVDGLIRRQFIETENLDIEEKFFTIQTIKPQEEFLETIKNINKRKKFNQLFFVAFTILLSSLILIAYFSFYVKNPNHESNSLQDILPSRDSKKEDYTEDQIHAKNIKKTISKWDNEKSDLQNRIASIKQEIISNQCILKWRINDLCYISDRNMSQSEIERELIWMQNRVDELNEILRGLISGNN